MVTAEEEYQLMISLLHREMMQPDKKTFNQL